MIELANFRNIKVTFYWIFEILIDISVTKRIENVTNCLNENTNQKHFETIYFIKTCMYTLQLHTKLLFTEFYKCNSVAPKKSQQYNKYLCLFGVFISAMFSETVGKT